MTETNERRKRKTIRELEELTAELNKKWFHGKLTYILTVNDGPVRALAFVSRPDENKNRQTHPPVCQLHLTPKIFYMTDDYVEEVILHELCHVAQFYHGFPGGHGVSMRRIGAIYDIQPRHILEAKKEMDR